MSLVYPLLMNLKQRQPPAPNALFLPSSPLNSAPIESPSPQSTSINKTANDQSTARTPLESIAEMLETPSAPTQPMDLETEPKAFESESKRHLDENEKRKLSALYLRSTSSPSQLETQPGGSTSPIPSSEANASIDLNCDTPASASIDIQDHNLKPTDRIASVLHPRDNERPGELPKSTQSPPKIAQPIEEESSEQESQVTKQDSNHIQAVGTPDSIDSEEAAAIRIQSAFRGYRTRKNSPYRTRSPTSSPGNRKRNALRQQEAAVLLEEEADSARVAAATEAELLANGVEMSRVEGRRSSRARQRDGSSATGSMEEPADENANENNNQTASTVAEGLQQRADQRGPVIESSASLDEHTATTDDITVKEISAGVLDQQVGNVEESAVVSQSGQLESYETSQQAPTIQMDRNGIQLPATPSLSLEVGESDLAAAVRDDQPNLSAALEASPATANTNYADELEGSNPPPSAPRPSVGSAETDSSVLGAALSEEMSEEAPPASTSPPSSSFKPIDEDKLPADVSMTTDELELEARRLVDEMTGDSQPSNQTFNQMGAALEDATTADDSFAANESVLLNEEEQRAIELESDDIERRDPRGQVSEERAKSPQIRTEEPKFESPAERQVKFATDDQQEATDKAGNANLNVEPLGELGGSGRSSPAFNSSGCGSSSSGSDRDGEDEGHNGGVSKQNEASQKRQQQQQASSSATPTGRNKKRNRNKRKGKK